MKKIVFAIGLLCSTLFAKTYTDMLGRVVEVNASSKLVCIGPGALRMAVYMGLTKNLVGIEKIEYDPNPLSPYRVFLMQNIPTKLPIIGTGGPGKIPNLEALVSLKPDVIVASFIDKNQLDMISAKTGIPVVALSYGASYGGTSEKNLDEIKKSLLFLGALTHHETRSHELVRYIQSQEEILKTIKLPSTKIYIGGVSYKGVQGITSTEATYPPFELLGLKNSIFEGTKTQGHQFIDRESLLKTDPEIIFIDRSSKEKIAQEYAEQKVLFDVLRAYKTGNVKEVLGFNNYSTNVENLLFIAWQVAYYLGEKLDLNAKGQEIYEAFYGTQGDALFMDMNHP